MASKNGSIKLSEINQALSDYKVQSLERVVMEGDIEIEVDLSNGAKSTDMGCELTMLALQLFSFSKAMGYPAELCFNPRTNEKTIGK
jgi:hypothetical protein